MNTLSIISVNRLKEMEPNFPDAIGNEEGDNPAANHRQEPMPEQSKSRTYYSLRSVGNYDSSNQSVYF